MSGFFCWLLDLDGEVCLLFGMGGGARLVGEARPPDDGWALDSEYEPPLFCDGRPVAVPDELWECLESPLSCE